MEPNRGVLLLVDAENQTVRTKIVPGYKTVKCVVGLA